MAELAEGGTTTSLVAKTRNRVFPMVWKITIIMSASDDSEARNNVIESVVIGYKF
jgi:hypothetical protein